MRVSEANYIAAGAVVSAYPDDRRSYTYSSLTLNSKI